MTLSDNQIKQAEELVRKDLIQELDPNNWLVSSVSGNGSYEVERVDKKEYSYDLYCKCQGWKFSKTKDCKHCEAIRIYESAKLKKGFTSGMLTAQDIKRINSFNHKADQIIKNNKSKSYPSEKELEQMKKKQEIKAWISKTKMEIMNKK